MTQNIWCADVAQSVEQRFRKPWVAGSIPVIGTLVRNIRPLTQISLESN